MLNHQNRHFWGENETFFYIECWFWLRRWSPDPESCYLFHWAEGPFKRISKLIWKFDHSWFKKRVWANWITIDEVLAAKLGIDMPTNKRPRKVFIGLSNDHHHVCNCAATGFAFFNDQKWWSNSQSSQLFAESGLLQICKCQKLEQKKLDDSESFSLGKLINFIFGDISFKIQY